MLGLSIACRFKLLLDAAALHGKFRPQLIALGDDFFHRQGEQHFEPPAGEACRTALHRRQKEQPEQRRDQEAERKNHRLFNQGAASRTTGTTAESGADNATAKS